MAKFIDLTGQRFGSLTVTNKTTNRSSDGCIVYKCTCDCGKETVASSSLLRSKRKTSCGCLVAKNALIKIDKYDLANYSSYKGTKVSALTSKLSKSNKSGHKGISWDKFNNKWVVQIKLRGKNYKIGRYTDIKNAIKARKLAEEKLFHPIIEEYEKENANVE